MTGIFTAYLVNSQKSKSFGNDYYQPEEIEEVKVGQPTPTDIPHRKVLSGGKHVYQTFNNCGPASLSMALSYYSINISQEDLGRQLRPYQNPQGDNDDKTVTLAEAAKKAEEYDFLVYQRPGGSIQILRQLISLNLPVVVKTWLEPGEDIGHFRVIKGYDQNKKLIIQDDSLQGKNLTYTYQQFNRLWQAFNFEFLILAPQNKQQKVEKILGDLVDETSAWQQALQLADSQLSENPEDIYFQFNRLRANYYLGNYRQTVDIFEEIKSRLPRRMLWYQIEPILAYYQLGDFDQVLTLTNQVFESDNRAFSELYYLRAKIFEQQGNQKEAEKEYQLAEKYNQSDYWQVNLLSLNL